MTRNLKIFLVINTLLMFRETNGGRETTRKTAEFN